MRHEVEDHLWEAVAADPTSDRLEAERRAIANFGDPHVIAAQFAVVSLAKQTRRVGAAVVLVVAGVFIVMKARVAWFAVTQWTMSDDMRAVSSIVLLIDRCSFWLSGFFGMAGFVYITGRRVPSAFYPIFHEQLCRFFFLCVAATGALVVSVISDGILTALQLHRTQLCFDSLIPIFSMAMEIACASVLAYQVRCIARRTTGMASSLKT